MPEYRIQFTSRADRQLRKLPVTTQKRLGAAIDALASDPRPSSARCLRGREDLLRIRVGACRVVYTIEDDRLVVLVVKLGHRKDIYRER